MSAKRKHPLAFTAKQRSWIMLGIRRVTGEVRVITGVSESIGGEERTSVLGVLGGFWEGAVIAASPLKDALRDSDQSCR